MSILQGIGKWVFSGQVRMPKIKNSDLYFGTNVSPCKGNPRMNKSLLVGTRRIRRGR